MKEFLRTPPGKVIAGITVLIFAGTFIWQTGLAGQANDFINDTLKHSPINVDVEEGIPCPAAAATKLTRPPTNVQQMKQLTPTGLQNVALQLSSQRSATLDIYQMRVNILSEAPPLKGALVFGQCGGGTSSIVLTTQLNSSASVLRDAASTNAPYFPSHHITLSPRETIELVVAASAVQHTYAWDLSMDYVYNGHNQTVTVDGGGVQRSGNQSRPFMVTDFATGPGEYGTIFSPVQSGLQLVPPSEYCSNPFVLGVHGWRC